MQTELARQEQSMAESRKEREVVLSDYRKQADEKKEFAEKVERRVGLSVLTYQVACVNNYLSISTAEASFNHTLHCSM